jgi:hypothetical protein
MGRDGRNPLIAPGLAGGRKVGFHAHRGKGCCDALWDVGDGVLSPGETVIVDFVIGLQTRAPFTFEVELFGEPLRLRGPNPSGEVRGHDGRSAACGPSGHVEQAWRGREAVLPTWALLQVGRCLGKMELFSRQEAPPIPRSVVNSPQAFTWRKGLGKTSGVIPGQSRAS